MKYIGESKDLIKIDPKVLEFNIISVQTHYYESIWVEDKYGLEGGNFQNIKKTYETPMVEIKFKAIVNIDLHTGATYTDGINLFIAINKNSLINYGNVVKTFSIPKQIILLSKDF